MEKVDTKEGVEQFVSVPCFVFVSGELGHAAVDLFHESFFFRQEFDFVVCVRINEIFLIAFVERLLAQVIVPICLAAEEIVQVSFDKPVSMQGVWITSEDAEFFVAQSVDVLFQIHALGKEAVCQQAGGGSLYGLFLGLLWLGRCFFLIRVAGGRHAHCEE